MKIKVHLKDNTKLELENCESRAFDLGIEITDKINKNDFFMFESGDKMLIVNKQEINCIVLID